MTEKPTTNIIEMGDDAEPEPGSPASGGELPLSPSQILNSPGLDGAVKKVSRQQNAVYQRASITSDADPVTQAAITI